MIIGNDFASLYVIRKIDIDGSYYDHRRECLLTCSDPSIRKIIDDVKKQIKQALYIKWNWLYFIYKGQRFVEKVSYSTDEYIYIRYLINKLRLNGCSCIYYDGGVLD